MTEISLIVTLNNKFTHSRTSIFPDRLKEAQVTPLFKKNDILDKKNYRPVSVLNNISKVLKGLFVTKYVSILNKFLTTF